MAKTDGVREIRRLVTGHDAAGKAGVVMDGPAPNVNTYAARPGFAVTQLWIADETPVSNAGDEDPTLAPFTLLPPDGGSVFRILEYPPGETHDGEAGRDAIQDQRIEGATHPGMHRTRTVDYTVVLSGEIDLILDSSVTRLKAGDVVVQRGTAHAWSNPGDVPCQIMFVLVDAKPL